MGFLNYLKPGRAEKPADNANNTRKATHDARPTTQNSLSNLNPFTSGRSEKSTSAEMDELQKPTTATTAASQPGLLVPTVGSSPLDGAFSRPASLYPDTAFREAQNIASVAEIRSDVMANWLFQQQTERMWTLPEFRDEGVVLKKTRNEYVGVPQDLSKMDNGFYNAVVALNVRCAMTIHTRVIGCFLAANDRPYVPLKHGLRLQVLPNMASLPRCQKHQFAAFIADREVMVVWDDEPRHLLDRAAKIEKALIEMIWDNEDEVDEEEAKTEGGTTLNQGAGDDNNIERGAVEVPRKANKLMPIQSGFCVMLVCTALGAGWSHIAVELKTDHYWLRLLFLVALPAQVWLALFFFQAICGSICQIFGPVSQMKGNSKFYSGVKPRRLRRDAGPLPHVTIQMPVYKEGLKAVIEPTIMSIKSAISTYEMQGGTANIFVNDDGMQVIPAKLAEARQDFYDEHNIGWIARPKHNEKPKEDDRLFLRRGKFKKASNMNYGMWVSARIEDKLNELDRKEGWIQEGEAAEYHKAMAEVIKEDDGYTWADGNVRIGDYILIIDCDTRVPEDCFLDCVSEMEQSPQVAILQFSAGVLNVTNSFFERGITFFTNLIYTMIRYSVASGDVAPFVGHNAILRWNAMQEIAYDCKDDHREKYWSESTVSEDFDMALRMQSAGYLVRLAGYTGGGFKEGVSLTVYDELSRWEKYAYGCSELIFHPVRYWPTRGPFTKLFRNFLCSGMPIHSKVTIMAYIGTYYAIGSAWILTLANYFLTGWLLGYLDHFYIDSFKVYFSIIVVFSALGNIALAMLRYRDGRKGLVKGLVENLMWVPLLSIFLGGISLHVSQAILSHLFELKIEWGATSKEAEDTSFFNEIPKIADKFKYTFIFCLAMTAMMIVLAQFAPPLWRIDTFISIWPLSTIMFGHFALPILLNPGLMRFTW